MVPPYIVPAYIAASMMIPEVGSMPNVSGRSIATPEGGPTPGSAPISMPTITPATTITSVLINTPGESASVVTCLDGYQMALQGRAGPALGIAAIGSVLAGPIGGALLLVVAPLLARWALSFGPPESFALMLLGLTTVTLLGGDDPLKGYISMVFGLML